MSASRPEESAPGVGEPLSRAELTSVLALLNGMRPRVRTVVVGSSRDAPSRQAAAAVSRAWTGCGGEVLDVVDWPEKAASWLRQARRFTAQDPDAWVVTGQARGWLGMARRLARSTRWDPARTLATASLADDALIAADGAGTFDGMRGVFRDGGIWEVAGTRLLHSPGSEGR